MLKMVSSSGQLPLGKKYAGKYFEIEPLEDGALILRPMKLILKSEAGMQEPETQNKLRQTKEWATEKSPTESDLDAFLDRVENRQ